MASGDGGKIPPPASIGRDLGLAKGGGSAMTDRKERGKANSLLEETRIAYYEYRYRDAMTVVIVHG